MKKNNTFRRAAALVAALSITVSLAAPAFAGTYYIDYGNITITKDEHGKQTVQQGENEAVEDSGEIIITTEKKVITTQESDLEGPAAEDSGFGPVVEDNYQPAPPAQPEDAEEPKDADQPESAEEPKDADQPEGTDQPEDAEEPKAADRKESTEKPEDADQQESAEQQAQPQQAAPADAAPAAPAPANGFCKNIITVINNAATALKLTLKDVKIDVSDTGKNTGIPETSVKGKAALSVQGSGDVEIELDGENELKSGFNRAGLEKNTSDSTGTLTLKDDKKDDNKEAGSLKATGGKYGAGIGGSKDNGTNNITINGGTVTARGGEWAAGIGGGSVGAWGGDAGSGKNITINGGTVNATGTDGGAGIGGGENGNGEDITINGGKVNASGAYGGAGIGGGVNGIGSKVTVSGAAQVTATATGSGPDWSGVGTGATIGNGGSKTPDGPVDGKEIQADISHLTTGYIHHIIYNPDLDSDGKPDGILKEWWEFALPKPIPDGESLDLHVETLKGAPLLFNTRQQGSTLRVTTDNLSARLHGTRQALETLQEQGVEQIEFVTTLKTTTLSVEDLLTEGGSWFALEHDGLASRRLSAAQAESLKCWRH